MIMRFKPIQDLQKKRLKITAYISLVYKPSIFSALKCICKTYLTVKCEVNSKDVILIVKLMMCQE